MRINAGEFRGFSIRSKDIPGTRPTSDKVKQAIFNILGPGIAGKTVLDLFCGFGALGLEALSRGAGHAVFVDSNPRCMKLLQENLKAMRVEARASVLCLEVLAALQRLADRQAGLDIVLCDAPYPKPGQARSSSPQVLNELGSSPILKEVGVVIMQHASKETMPSEAGTLTMHRSYRYGNTGITVYKKGSRP